MAPHEERVVAEKTELDEKISKLTAFIFSLKFDSLTSEEKDRLSRQHRHMQEYSAVLEERIDSFT